MIQTFDIYLSEQVYFIWLLVDATNFFESPNYSNIHEQTSYGIKRP